jgi:hypothetical protein
MMAVTLGRTAARSFRLDKPSFLRACDITLCSSLQSARESSKASLYRHRIAQIRARCSKAAALAALRRVIRGIDLSQHTVLAVLAFMTRGLGTGPGELRTFRIVVSPPGTE